MSYSRWSTILDLDLTEATGEADPVNASVAWWSLSETDRFAEMERQGAVASGWYIYWDASSDNDIGCNGQLLAVWPVRGDCLLMDYRELRRIANRGDWNFIPGYADTAHPRDQRNLRDCVWQWLADVEDEFPPAPALSRRQRVQHYGRKAQDSLRADDSGPDGNDHFGLWRARVSLHRMRDLARWARAAGDPDAAEIDVMIASVEAEFDEAERRVSARFGGWRLPGPTTAGEVVGPAGKED